MSGMGLINREKRQHAWPARTMAPPTFACAGVRAPRCSLVRCPSHFPKVAALGPEASDSAPPRPEQRACILGRQQGWRFNSGAPSVRTSSHLTPYASFKLPALSGRPPRPPNCRFTSAKASTPSRAAFRIVILIMIDLMIDLPQIPFSDLV